MRSGDHVRSGTRGGFPLVFQWVRATLGIIAVAGLSSILVIALIVGLIAPLLDSSRGVAIDA